MFTYVNQLQTETGIRSTTPIIINQVITPRDKSSTVRNYSALSNPFEQGGNNPYATTAPPSGNNPYNTTTTTTTTQIYSTGGVNTYQLPQVQGGVPPIPRRPAVALPRATAIWDFAGQNPTELSFAKGDVLTILEKTSNWWKAEMNGRQGLIPSNYVQEM